MTFLNVFKPSFIGGSNLGSQQFRLYTSVNTNIFYNPNLRPFFTGGSFLGSFNFRTGLVIAPVIVTPLLQTFFQIFDRDGGLKKTWFYNQDSDTPAIDLKIEITINGSGAGTLKLAYLDFPIVVEDYIKVLSGGEVIYKGFFTNNVDVSDPIGKLSPYSQRLKEITFTGSFVNTDPFDILETVITTTSSNSSINWNVTKVNFPDLLSPLTVEYQAEPIYNIVEEIVNRGFNKYFGVDVENDFFVEQANSTVPDKKIYLGENPRYDKITVKEDLSKIKMTEAEVYAKRTVIISGEDVTNTKLIGTVGTGGSYPVLELRKRFRKIQGKLTAPEVLQSDTAVLDWGYARLVEKEAKIRKTIKLDGYDLITYPLEIGTTLQVEDKDKLTILDLQITSSLTNWTGASIGVGRYQNDAIVITTGRYDFGRCQKWYKQEKINFTIKGSIDQVVKIALSDNITPLASEFKTIILASTGVFQFYNIEYTTAFRFIHFDVTGSAITIDEISSTCYHKTQHVEQVNSITVQWQPDKIKTQVKLGDLIDEETYESFVMSEKVRILETIDKF